jgi:hypothetical protein
MRWSLLAMPMHASAQTPVVALPVLVALSRRIQVPMLEVSFTSVACLRGSLLAARHIHVPLVVRLPAAACAQKPDAAARLVAAVVSIADETGVVDPIAVVVDVADGQPLSVTGQVERAIASGASGVAIAVSAATRTEAVAATTAEAMPYELVGDEDDALAWLSAHDNALTPIAVRGHDPEEGWFASAQTVCHEVEALPHDGRLVVPTAGTEMLSYHALLRFARAVGADQFAGRLAIELEDAS